MSDHTKAFVPIETWLYCSPDLSFRGKTIDLGLFAESLVYYESILVHPGNPGYFRMLVNWFRKRGEIEEFISLIDQGIVSFLDYGFHTLPLVDGDDINLYNETDLVMDAPGSFLQRYLSSQQLRQTINDRDVYERFINVASRKFVEVKASELEGVIQSAKEDILDARRYEILLQALVDEVYRIKKLGKPPRIQAEIQIIKPGEIGYIRSNINFEILADYCGVKGVPGRASPAQAMRAMPISGAGNANKFIWTAALNDLDLYLPRPMSSVVGDKFYEATKIPSTLKTKITIDALEAEIEFPDLRKLVNQGSISLKKILEIRERAGKFRAWLQQNAERDRNEIIAYHNEVAKEVGLKAKGLHLLQLFNVVGAPGAIGSVTGALASSDPLKGALVGGVVGGGISFITSLASKLVSQWKPTVFGNWYKNRIEQWAEEDRRFRQQSPLGLSSTEDEAETY